MVVGTGAMGSVYAGVMAEAGYEILAVDIRRDHLDAIREKGLRLEGFSGNRTIQGIRVADTPEEAGSCDLVIIATKALDVVEAGRSVAPALTPETPVLTIQNGLGSGTQLTQVVPKGNVVIGVAGGFGASIKGPGHVHHNGMALVSIGEIEGGLTERVHRITRIWNVAGFNAREYENIDQLIWEKFICNVTLAAPCTIYDRNVGQMMEDSEAWKLCITCGLEAYTAGRSKGVSFSFEDPVDYITRYSEKLLEARPSMLLDHYAKRLSEINFINGMVPVVAGEVGTRAPYNEVMSTLIRSREAGFGDAP